MIGIEYECLSYTLGTSTQVFKGMVTAVAIHGEVCQEKAEAHRAMLHQQAVADWSKERHGKTWFLQGDQLPMVHQAPPSPPTPVLASPLTDPTPWTDGVAATSLVPAVRDPTPWSNGDAAAAAPLQQNNFGAQPGDSGTGNGENLEFLDTVFCRISLVMPR